MSGRDLVDEMRSGARPLPKRPRSAVDLVIGGAALIAVAGLGFVAFNTFVHRPPPRQVQVAAAPAPSIEQAGWSEDDESGCKAMARKAVETADSGDTLTVSPAITEGVAGLATLTTCKLTRKTTRFCADGGKAQVVAIVNDYLGRMDLVTLGVGAQGAPMAIAGGLFGGEPQSGSAIYDEMARQTLAYMADWDKKVKTAVRTLARKGVVTADDFGTFGGVPENIGKLFADIEPGDSLCT